MKHERLLIGLAACSLALAAKGEVPPIPGFPEKLLQGPTEEELAAPARIEHPADIARPLTQQEEAAQKQATALDTKAVASMRDDAEKRIAFSRSEDEKTNRDVQEFCASQGIELNMASYARPAVVQEEAQGGGEQAARAQASENSSSLGEPFDAKDDMMITCDKGVYFDSAQGLLVYIGNVKLRDPRMDLDCDSQLKIYLQEGPADKAKPDPAQKPEGDQAAADSQRSQPKTPADTMNVNFDGLKKVTAEGNVVVSYKASPAKNGAGQTASQGKPFLARAQHVTYNALTGEILLTGGRPSLQDDKNIVRCLSDDGYIRVSESGQVYIHGRTKTEMRDVQSQDSPLGQNSERRNRRGRN